MKTALKNENNLFTAREINNCVTNILNIKNGEHFLNG